MQRLPFSGYGERKLNTSSVKKTYKQKMKKILLVCLIINCIQFIASGQERPLRQDEITWFNNLYPVLYNAIPHEYQDWKAVGDGKDFDVIKYFCPVEYADNSCRGKCPVSLGKGDPYSLNYKIEFSMPSEQSDGLAGSAYKSITDFNNATQIAAALKSTAKSKLSIQVMVNISSGGSGAFLLSYCSKSPPEKITLPIPATLALIGIHSDGCPFMSDGRPDMSPGDAYYDNAIIFLGKPVAGQTADDRHDGQVRTRYAIAFDKSKIGVPVTQNIVVQIKGDAADINAAIKLIDWKKLYYLIGK